jgi:hypothetical protein
MEEDMVLQQFTVSDTYTLAHAVLSLSFLSSSLCVCMCVHTQIEKNIVLRTCH